MESGPSRVNAPLEGPVIPRSRRDLFKDQSFGGRDKAYSRQTSCMRMGRCMQRKSWGGEVERTGNGAVEGNVGMGNGCECLPGA